jgi:hypothetical protein
MPPIWELDDEDVLLLIREIRPQSASESPARRRRILEDMESLQMLVVELSDTEISVSLPMLAEPRRIVLDRKTR